jgi:hypothetical protein
LAWNRFPRGGIEALANPRFSEIATFDRLLRLSPCDHRPIFLPSCHLSINRGDNMMSVSLDVADVGSTG